MSLICRAETHTSDVLLNNNLYRGAPSKVVSCRIPQFIYKELEDAAARLNLPVSTIFTYILTNFSNHFVFIDKEV